MATATTPAVFGECSSEDLAALDEAAKAFREAEETRDSKRAELGAVMKRMLEAGAQRKAIAARLEVNDQTVSNMAYGRPGKK